IEHAGAHQVLVHDGVEPAVVDDVVHVPVGIVVHPACGDRMKVPVLITPVGRLSCAHRLCSFGCHWLIRQLSVAARTVLKCTATVCSISWPYPPAIATAMGMDNSRANAKTRSSRFAIPAVESLRRPRRSPA